MKLLKLSGFTFFSLLAFLPLAQISAQSDHINTLLNSVSAGDRSRAQGAFALLPPNQREGIENYLALIGVETRVSQNVGINNFNSQYREANPCFSALFDKFRRKLAARDRQLSKPNRLFVPGYSLASSITDIGGRPGEVWELAMTVAKNDKLLAIQLLGQEGHDDLEIERENFLYAPLGLGSKYDISPQLKARIAQIQAPTLGASKLPAKAYHITGSAYASCQLVSRGVPDFIASQMVRGSINAYRANRICDKLAVKSERPDDASLDFLDLPDSEAITSLKNNRAFKEHLKISRPDEILRRLRSSRKQLDVAQMFQNGIEYTISNKCDPIQTTTAVRDFLKRNSSEGQRNPCPKTFSAIRCKAARDLMLTYLVDFEWSEAQHMLGYQFAKENCPRYVESRRPEVVACEILGRPNPDSVSPSRPSTGGRSTQ